MDREAGSRATDSHLGKWRLGLVLALAFSGAAGADIFDPGRVDAVRKLSDEAIELGFPDAKGAMVYSGLAMVRSVIDPKKEKPAFPVSLSTAQSTVAGGGGEMEYFYEFEGLHFKLADGSWLLALNAPFRPSDSHELRIDEGAAVDLATAHAKALELHPIAIREVAPPGWIDGYPEADREKICNVLDKAVPLLDFLQIGDDAPVALALLHRAGLKQAPLLAHVIADSRSRQFWQQRYWFEEPAPFDPTEAYLGMAGLEEKWREEKGGTYPLEPIDVAFRRGFHRSVRASLMNERGLLPPEAAASLAKAALDPGDPQNIGRSIDLLAGGRAIDDELAPDAPLRERLAAWGRPKEPEMQVVGGEVDDDGDGKSFTMSTSFLMPVESYTPTVDELGALFALLGDDAPCKWSDFQGGRTVGENAMRAIARVLGSNPLELVEMAGLDPWTPERRKTANTKLQAWWKGSADNLDAFIEASED